MAAELAPPSLEERATGALSHLLFAAAVGAPIITLAFQILYWLTWAVWYPVTVGMTWHALHLGEGRGTTLLGLQRIIDWIASIEWWIIASPFLFLLALYFGSKAERLRYERCTPIRVRYGLDPK